MQYRYPAHRVGGSVPNLRVTLCFIKYLVEYRVCSQKVVYLEVHTVGSQKGVKTRGRNEDKIYVY